MTTVYIALGSNLGNREENLKRAVDLLKERGIPVQTLSSLYETEPVDFLEQGWFLNAVLAAETDLPSLQLLQILRSIETAMGSKKPFPKGPRLIDLDILLYGDQTIDAADLRVPHPRMLQRKFVLMPLVEIAPQARHPSWNGTAQEMLAQTDDPSAVRKFP